METQRDDISFPVHLYNLPAPMKRLFSGILPAPPPRPQQYAFGGDCCGHHRLLRPSSCRVRASPTPRGYPPRYPTRWAQSGYPLAPAAATRRAQLPSAATQRGRSAAPSSSSSLSNRRKPGKLCIRLV